MPGTCDGDMVLVDQNQHDSDFYVRPTWDDAALTLQQINKGKARGRTISIFCRSLIQEQFYTLGCFLRRNAGPILFISVVILSLICVGLKSKITHYKLDQLWIEEGGTVGEDLDYMENVIEERRIDIPELVIQTPKESYASILQEDALLHHFRVLKAALQVKVTVFHIQWRLDDLCVTYKFNTFEDTIIDQVFDAIIPCVIMTPLDCFWEGSKIHDLFKVAAVPKLKDKLKWSTLNPQKIMEKVSVENVNNFPLQFLQNVMKKAGITTGYQEKPCLNRLDEDCPVTAPNKNSTRELDIGAQLTGGCSGFAPDYMKWPEDAIVGGYTKNKSGYITKAHALQTIIPLMGERELFESFRSHQKVQQIYWSVSKAAMVLERWQEKFAEEVKNAMKKAGSDARYNILPFSLQQMNEMLKKYSEPDTSHILQGCLIMMLFVAASQFNWNNPVSSQTAIAIIGFLLVCLSNIAALGVCAVIGIPFNTLTIHVMPFFGLAFGIMNLFTLLDTHAKILEPSNNNCYQDHIGVLLRKCGLNIVLVAFCCLCAFIWAAIIPIPVMRSFSLQSAILVLFNLVTSLLIIPAIIKIDLSRRKSGRVDIFYLCCVNPGEKWPCIDTSSHVENGRMHTADSFNLQNFDTLTPLDLERNGTPHLMSTSLIFDTECPKISSLITMQCILQKYSEFLLEKSIKIFTFMLIVGLTVGSVWQIYNRMMIGLNLSDIMPTDTKEYAFLEAQENHFGFYNIFAVTKDFDYPRNQHLLYDYYYALSNVTNVKTSQFWLIYFKDWLKDLQAAFDKDKANNCFSHEGWSANVTEQGKLAYKLAVQTGNPDRPIDKSQIDNVRLVDSDDIINVDSFYNYLWAWLYYDTFAYSASQTQFRPDPSRIVPPVEDDGDSTEFILDIPKADPLIYSEISFNLHGLNDTMRIKTAISEIREISKQFVEQGLPNFVTGIPFLFWGHYQELHNKLCYGITGVLVSIFVICLVFLVNPWNAFFITFCAAIMAIQMLGMFVFMDVKMNVVSAVLFIAGVGFNMHFIVHICVSFLTGIGNYERRLVLAIKHTFSLVILGGMAMSIAFSILMMSKFDFIISYAFKTFIIINIVGFVNGLLFIPILLSMFGPPPEVIPLNFPYRMSTPTPEIKRKSRRTNCLPQTSETSSSQHKKNQRSYSTGCGGDAPKTAFSRRNHRRASLSTISEEQSSYMSASQQEIIIEPEVTLEATITQPTTCCNVYNQQQNSYANAPTETCDNSRQSSPTNTAHQNNTNTQQNNENNPTIVKCVSNDGSHVTTKVTATTKIKFTTAPIHGVAEKNGQRFLHRRYDSDS